MNHFLICKFFRKNIWKEYFNREEHNLPISRYFYAIQHKIGTFYIPKPKKDRKFARSKG